MKSLFAGPSAALRGLSMLGKHGGLIPRMLVPALVALVMSIFGIWAALRFGPDLFAWLWPEPDGWLYSVWWVVNGVFQIATSAMSVLLTPWLIMLVGLPLCEPLVGRAEAALGAKAVTGTFVGEIARTLTTSLGLVTVGIVGAIGFFLLGLIPGVGVITAPFVAFVWTPMFLAMDVCDSSMARRQLNLRQKVKMVLTNPLRMWSLGMTSMFLVSIPLLNLVGLPVAVLAGVLVVRDLDPRDTVDAA